MTKTIHTDGYQRLIRILIDARSRSGLTQQQLADRLEKPQSFVAKYETFERRLDIAEYIQVGKLVGVEVTVTSGQGSSPRRHLARRTST